MTLSTSFLDQLQAETLPCPGCSTHNLLGEHYVQFYEREETLVRALAKFVEEGLSSGEAVIVIATPAHRTAVNEQLRGTDLDLEQCAASGAYVELDAAEVLSRFMDGDHPDQDRFLEALEPVLLAAGEGGRPVRAFGEMVALLVDEKKATAAIELEELWNELGSRHRFTLFCAYPIGSFSGEENEQSLLQVCASHSNVVPAESFSSEKIKREQAVAVAMLQQKAASLRAETAARQAAEQSLNDKKVVMSELEAFGYSLSHDLRAPLRAMRGYAEVLLEEFGRQLPGEAAEYLRRIATAGTRMDQLIHEMLNYSRIAGSQMVSEAVNLDHLVESVLECCPNLQAPHATISIEHPLPVVLGNCAALTKCFANLLDNAVKFVGPEKRAVIRAWAEDVGDFYRVHVCDNGIGVPEEDPEKIFDLFHRREPAYEGSGIGLATVKKAVQRMGGNVGCRRNPDGGSTFWLDLRRPWSGEHGEQAPGSP